jgi:hypothetical protein
MKRHAFDPFSFVFGIAVTALGLYFLIGSRTAADLGATWIWPFPVLLVGLAAVIYAVRNLRSSDPAAELARRNHEPLPEATAGEDDEPHGPPSD